MVRQGVLLASNLPQLQNLIKRDPASYRDEFLQQWSHYDSIRKIFLLNPEEQASHFRELVAFIAQVAPCYPKETVAFPEQLATLLLENFGTLNHDTRKSLVQNLVILRNKDVITSIDLLKTLFPLLPRTTSSALRAFIRKTILTDIRTANLRAKNHRLNRAVQAMVFGMVDRGMDAVFTGDKSKAKALDQTSSTSKEAMWAVILTKELWKRNVWTDTKTVSIMSLGCLYPNTKVQSASLHFFIGVEEEEEDSDESEDDVSAIAPILNAKGLQHRREINKKTRSGDRKLHKQLKSLKKKRKERSNKDATSANFPALHLLHDPQTFSEKLFDLLNQHDKQLSLDHKCLIMQVLSRVMGAHKLCVLSFYSYIVKYLTYHQLRIPAILVALAQSVHELTPPDVLTPVIRKLAQEFVHPGVGNEINAAGLNAIREVCRRQPWCMEEDLLGDLIEYKKSRDKGVTAAARGLLQLFREVNPELLKKRERGKAASMGMASGSKPLPFGHSAQAVVDIEGLTLLEAHLAKLRSEEGRNGSGDENQSNDGWDVDSDDSDSSDSGGWIEVSDDGEDIVISDSEDDGIGKDDTQVNSLPNPDVHPAGPEVSELATTKILTPADFALLNDLRIQEASKLAETTGRSSAKRKLAALKAAKSAMQSNDDPDSFISENDILGPRKKIKADYAERMESVQKGREGREKFGSAKGKRKKDNPSSTTNREKARNKPIMMIMGSGAVRGKKKASLREKQKRMRAHIDKAKKSHH